MKSSHEKLSTGLSTRSKSWKVDLRKLLKFSAGINYEMEVEGHRAVLVLSLICPIMPTYKAVHGTEGD